MARPATPFEEMYKVAESGCWEWVRFVNPAGYGQMFRGGRTVMAHRFAWERARGPIPGDLTVDHLCFNTACVNPDHMQLATRSENSARRQAALSNVCRWGHEFTAENTGRTTGGHRMCRTCARRRARNQRAVA